MAQSRRFVRRVEILCLLKLWAWDDHIRDVIDPRVDIIVWHLCFCLTGISLIFTGFILIRNYTTVTEYKWQKIKKVSLMYLWEIYKLFKSLPKDLQTFLLANSLELTVRFLLSLLFQFLLRHFLFYFKIYVIQLNCFYFKVSEKVAISMAITELEASNWNLHPCTPY